MLVTNITSAWDRSVDLLSGCWLILLSPQLTSSSSTGHQNPTKLAQIYLQTLSVISDCLTFNHLSNSYSSFLVKLNNIINRRIFPQIVALQTIYIKSRWIYKSVHCSIDTYWTHCVQRLHTHTWGGVDCGAKRTLGRLCLSDTRKSLLFTNLPIRHTSLRWYFKMIYLKDEFDRWL